MHKLFTSPPTGMKYWEVRLPVLQLNEPARVANLLRLRTNMEGESPMMEDISDMLNGAYISTNEQATSQTSLAYSPRAPLEMCRHVHDSCVTCLFRLMVISRGGVQGTGHRQGTVRTRDLNLGPMLIAFPVPCAYCQTIYTLVFYAVHVTKPSNLLMSATASNDLPP